MPNKALCLITALFIFDFMIRAENLHVRTYIISYSLIYYTAISVQVSDWTALTIFVCTVKRMQRLIKLMT